MCEGRRSTSLPGSLLGLHSLKLGFYKGPCLAERGKPARVKKKERGGQIQSSMQLLLCGGKYSSALWLVSVVLCELSMCDP